MIFDEIRGHLLILIFYMAQNRSSQGLFWKKAIKFDVSARYAKFSQKMSNIMKSKVKKLFLLVASSQGFANLHTYTHTPEIGLHLLLSCKIPILIPIIIR